MNGTGLSLAELGRKTLILVSRDREVEGNEYFVRVPVDTLFDDFLVNSGIVKLQ